MNFVGYSNTINRFYCFTIESVLLVSYTQISPANTLTKLYIRHNPEISERRIYLNADLKTINITVNVKFSLPIDSRGKICYNKLETIRVCDNEVLVRYFACNRHLAGNI